MNTREIKRLTPPSNIGIVGGGQLGRMMAHDAKRMGYNVIVLEPKPNSPTGQVVDEQIEADYSEVNAMKELAGKSDIITYEFEHIDVEMLHMLEQEGHKVFPSSNTLRMIQNKYIQKCKLQEAGVPVPKFYAIHDINELEEVFLKLDNRMVLKTCTGGYDGKGNAIIKDRDSLQEAYNELSRFELMAEEFIDFTMEASIIVARNQEEVVTFPIAENVHKNSILIKSTVPARISKEVEDKIKDIGKRVVEVIDDYGIFCIEVFVDKNDNVLVNEIAPRPHNSGHYTIEGCITSQFEQIIRVITGMPLGSTKLRQPSVMYNLLGSSDVDGEYSIEGIENILAMEDCHFHLYGKADTMPLKKIGHITALGDTVEEADYKAKKALESIKVVNRK